MRNKLKPEIKHRVINKGTKWAFRIPHRSSETMGPALRKLMGATGFTEITLAKRLGVSSTSIHYYLHEVRHPDQSMIRKIADIFQIAPTYFWEYRINNLLEFLEKEPKLVDVFLALAADPREIIKQYDEITETEDMLEEEYNL